MPNPSVTSAIEQIQAVKKECLQLLAEVNRFCPPDQNGRYPETFRLLATPILYSAWERCFTLCHAVALRMVRDVTPKAGDLSPPNRVVWLLQANFYQKLVKELRVQGQGQNEERQKRGQFQFLAEFLKGLDQWMDRGLDHGVGTDELVIKKSNVNSEVVAMNGLALGIAQYPQFIQLGSRFDQLDELVGRRNDIGHGGKLKGPSDPDFERLWNFTSELIVGYCDCFVSWISEKFSTS